MNQIYSKVLLAALLLIPGSAIGESVWYGYYNGEENLSEFGTGLSESYDCAIFLPGDIGQASGKSISKVRFTIQGTDEMKDLKIWLSTTLPKNPDLSDLGTYEIDLSNITDGIAYETVLPHNCRVPLEGLYVGYSFSAADPFPILTTDNSTTDANGFYMRTNKSYPNWRDFSQYKYGNLAIQVLLEGDNYLNAAQVDFIPETIAYPNETVTLPVRIMNYGSEGVRSLSYTIQEDDNEPESFVYDLPNPIRQPKETFDINLEFPSASSKGISYKNFTITGINGKENESKDFKTGRGAVITIEESAPRTTVMEEFTGTWCGWCPRGLVALEQLNKDFGDGFIGIAVHGDADPMVIDAYSEILAKVGGFPSCKLDREITGDPFFGSTYGLGSEPSYGIKSDVEQQLAKLTPAELGISSKWADGNKNHIEVTVSMRLLYPRIDTPDYNIAYVICADGLSNELWWQNNDFALPVAQSFKSDPYIGWLTEVGARIRNLTYNDVAIDAVAIDNGLPLSYNNSWDGETWQPIDSRTLSIEGNELAHNKDNISIVAIIIDNATGQIVNGVKAEVGNSKTSGIEEISESSASRTITAVYDLSGRRVKTRTQGINIVRYSDGSTEKTIVK